MSTTYVYHILHMSTTHVYHILHMPWNGVFRDGAAKIELSTFQRTYFAQAESVVAKSCWMNAISCHTSTTIHPVRFYKYVYALMKPLTCDCTCIKYMEIHTFPRANSCGNIPVVALVLSLSLSTHASQECADEQILYLEALATYNFVWVLHGVAGSSVRTPSLTIPAGCGCGSEAARGDA